jgi:phosphoglucosamine mutase
MSAPQFFGTDGIRGTAGQFPLAPDFVLRLGLATAQVLLHSSEQSSVVIGRDTRRSGQMLQNALSAGLLAGGANVIDLGIITTPGVAFLVRKLGAQAGVVISASHNPVHENGIKLFNAQGLKSSEPIEAEIEQLAQEPALFEKNSKQFGNCIGGADLHELYVQDLVSEHPGLRLDRFTLVMDCANGAAYRLGPECFTRLGAQVIAINATPSGLNINARAGSEHIRRQPDILTELIRRYKADFGLAFDGDADRVVLLDQAGNLIDGDHMLGILGQYLAQHNMLLGRTIVATSMRNTGLLNWIQSAGLNFIETKVGDKYVTEELLKLGQTAGALALGGEQAGHILLIDEQHTTGDGIRTALYMARVLAESGAASLTELASCVKKTPQVIASAKVKAKPPLDGIPELKMLEQALATQLPGLLKKELRYSGTEALFRAMLEADYRHSEAELAEQARAMCQAVQKASDTQDGSIEILNCTRGGSL